ncbi:MAG: YhfC family glutamic-type intramembrane protease [Eubacteriales bacterium]|nr:YhfC family glutamic-type intramembrane protease [Eubacteriales bacterium]
MIFIVISFLVCVGIPLTGAIYFLRRKDGTFLSFIVGAAGFFISQPLIRLSLLEAAREKNDWFTLLPYTNIVLYFVILGLTAGIAEECARWLGLGIFRKGRVSWMDGAAYGLGHGGFEAAWIFFVQIIPLAGTEAAGWNLAIAAWERLFTMMVHTGLTFVVLYGLKKKKIGYLGLAILLHGIVDFLIILGNPWVLEGLITAEGVLALVLVLRCRKNWDKKVNLAVRTGGEGYEKN